MSQYTQKEIEEMEATLTMFGAIPDSTEADAIHEKSQKWAARERELNKPHFIELRARGCYPCRGEINGCNCPECS